jgi:hypothetical protein
VNTAYPIKQNLKLLHRTAVHSLWTGDKPSAEDLMRQLEEPFQVKVLLAHAGIGIKPFQIGNVELVVPNEFFRTEMTPESFSAGGGCLWRFCTKRNHGDENAPRTVKTET